VVEGERSTELGARSEVRSRASEREELTGAPTPEGAEGPPRSWVGVLVSDYTASETLERERGLKWAILSTKKTGSC